MSLLQAAETARISGHESFPFRHGWLPKATRLVASAPKAWADTSEAMVELGLGKNMVVALRFWADAMRVVTTDARGAALTPFGRRVFGDHGFDPYLEQATTLWLLHWHLVYAAPPLLAWQSVFVGTRGNEFARTELIAAWRSSLSAVGRTASPVTLQQHFDMLVNCYASPTDHQELDSVEDGIECPLRELRLLEIVGTRRGSGTRTEPVYAMRRRTGVDVSNSTLAYAIADYWSRNRRADATLTLRDLTVIAGIGSCFALSDVDLLDRLETFGTLTDGTLAFHASRGVPRLARTAEAWSADWLALAYGASPQQDVDPTEPILARSAPRRRRAALRATSAGRKK